MTKTIQAASLYQAPWYFPPTETEPPTERPPAVKETPPEYWTQPYSIPQYWTWTGNEKKHIERYDYE